MDIIRSPQANAPVTAEEVAYKLFELITDGKPETLGKDQILPTFAKCMVAVTDPKTHLDKARSGMVKIKV